ncbi:SDR family NAD(P)-dependent oxidoreductase, partial [Streptomyces clavuligerus]
MRTAPPDLPTVALVTGAASGIGACAARALARRGVAVAALDIDETGLRDRLDGLPTVLPLVCDVSDSRAVAAAVQETEDALGPVDKVIHCAGTVRFGPLLEQPAEDLDRLVRVNYLGTAHIARETVSRMAARGYGDLVVIASVASWLPVAEIGAYGASKAAVQQFCQVLALECRGSGVRVVCVCPPAVETPLLDESRRTHPHV